MVEKHYLLVALLKMGEEMNKGRVCVTGGTGYLGSWMVKRLLQHGYSVNTTTRFHRDGKRDVSYLTNLPGASERLQIFDADLDRPESFAPAIRGCVGVFHVAHPLDFEERETEEVKTKRVVGGAIGILKACVDSGTVKRVVYCSSLATVAFNEGVTQAEAMDESSISDVDFLRKLGVFGGPYMVTKTLAEKAVMEYGEAVGLDVVSVLPSWIHGPFICSYYPDSVCICMALIQGNKRFYQQLVKTSLVHVDDVVRAHIHLFEYPQAKGRYICSNVDITIEQLHHFLSTKYPQFHLPSTDSFKDLIRFAFPSPSSRKLIDTGFKFENGLQEIFDGAIESCKEMGFL